VNQITKGGFVAAAAAALILSGQVDARASDKVGTDVVKCGGVNECKGHGACAGADNACKAQNECKGQGFEELTRDECEKKGGKTLE